MSERPLRPGDKLLLRQNSATVKAIVKSIEYRVDVHTFDHLPDDKLQLNDIGLVRLRTAQPLVFDAYRQNRHSGGFILVNENTYDTVAAGMLECTTELQFG